MSTWRLTLLMAVLFTACNDASTMVGDSGVGPVDARLMDGRAIDATGSVDRSMPDQGDAPPADGADRPEVSDAAPTDGAKADAGHRDMSADFGTIDGAHPDVGGPPMPDCVGTPPPPAPLDSPDGSEVCNYRDDDGDGEVDEGFEYELISPWIDVPRPARVGSPPVEFVSSVNISVAHGAIVVAWLSEVGLSTVFIDDDLCPMGPPVLSPGIEGRIPTLLQVTNNADTAASLGDYMSSDGSVSVLQLSTAQGTLGRPIRLNLEGEDRPTGLNVVTALDDRFLVYVVGPASRWTFEVAAPDWEPGPAVRLGPSAGLRSASEFREFDEGYGMLTTMVDGGELQTFWETWTRDWTRRPVVSDSLGPGYASFSRAPCKIGEDILYTFEVPGPRNELWISTFDNEGRLARLSPTRLIAHANPFPVVSTSLSCAPGQAVVVGQLTGERRRPFEILRVSAGRVSELNEVGSIVAIEFAPRAEHGLVALGMSSPDARAPAIARFGCFTAIQI